MNLLDFISEQIPYATIGCVIGLIFYQYDRHYPEPSWVKLRDDAPRNLKILLLSIPVTLFISYLIVIYSM